MVGSIGSDKCHGAVKRHIWWLNCAHPSQSHHVWQHQNYISKTTKNLSLLGTFHHFWAVQQVHKVAQGCTSCKVPESGQVIIWEYNNKVYFGYIVQTTN